MEVLKAKGSGAWQPFALPGPFPGNPLMKVPGGFREIGGV